MSTHPTPTPLQQEQRQQTRQTLRELCQALNALTAERIASTADASPQNTPQRPNEEEIPTYNASATQTYLHTLPVVNLSELAPDSSDCAICHEALTTEPNGKGPVRMNCCGRTLDLECITTWLSSPISHGRCPNCRTELFPPPPSYNHRLPPDTRERNTTPHPRRLFPFPQTNSTNSAAQETPTWTPPQSAIYQLGERRLHEILNTPSASISAIRVLIAFQFLDQSDLFLSQQERVHRWELLAAHIETVRARLVPSSGEVGLGLGSWWLRWEPSVPVLLAVDMRPLVEMYLDQLVRAEAVVRRG